jgi:myo-inositol-1(or 4)-monophosphatase
MNRALLATCVSAAVRAAEIIRERAASRAAITWETKAHADFVSDVDRSAERAIVETVLARHDNARILGEELSPTMSDRSGLVFVADPLDGTTNFLHGLPWYAVSIAAMIDEVLVAGVVLNAANGELFTATAGGGARLNGEPIVISTITDPARSLIGTGFPFRGGKHVDEYLRILPSIMREAAGIRRPGSAALDLASVACGRFQGFWELSLCAWDLAAGVLLIREAGGMVTDATGGDVKIDTSSIVAGNPVMHAWLLERVRLGGSGVGTR